MSKIDWDKIKVIVLDRDGVINHDSDDYIKSAEEWIPIAGSLPAIAKLNRRFKVAIATNQSGIARGFYDEPILHAMHDKMDSLLQEYSGHIDHIEYCPHHPDDGCACRKPETQMLEHIADKFSAKPEEMVFIGDSSSDYHCAQNFGCPFVLLLTGKGLKTLNKLAGKDLIVEKSLAMLVDSID
ncbi:D-glycero-beta-D-manno-heptose 1,7-bisphosphate 7-phosphatase [Kangiella sp.]|uniref:D-glycero-beta-D-manno-heptose 1,7-bisphosphate 7-phosphatase n=1 Tax=Kangiella sp. TaxID=1920245 RepID=UPI0019C0791D|nr:D-glycero-beta-D-manno-heptose 1,7-bisphosphate 7-phosphatase [Kangiella sp.]MBD3653458.1 D-glycero-beta-D-manno-heptose 1,7-bisphosphate 7-phosphatase [Kangiella sp.]